MEPVERVYNEYVTFGRPWRPRPERKIVFKTDMAKADERLESVTAETLKEHEKRNPEYGPNHRFYVEDWEDLRLERERAKKENEKEVASLPLPVILLGCRNCGYVEWRVRKS